MKATPPVRVLLALLVFAACSEGGSPQRAATTEIDRSQELELTARPAPERGVEVVDVAQGGLAERAGIEPGDIIVAAMGATVRSVEDISVRLRDARRLPFLILHRNGEHIRVFFTDVEAGTLPLGRADRVPRQCATYCLREATETWYECGCQVVTARVCTGCSG